MNKLSVIILTFNEQENISRAINSVLSISSDIVIVDSGSTDKTFELSEKLGASVFNNKLVSFASQRNFANQKTKNDWVLSMDADEVIPKELCEEILGALEDSSFNAYLIPRRNIIFGKEIKHTRWSPDKHVWLYDKTKGEWKGSVHEEWVASGPAGSLNNGKLHYSHKNVGEFIDMLNHYTDIEADILIKSGVKSNVFWMVFFAIRSFVGRFFIKLGFLDGYHGFVLSVLMAFYRFITWAKVWERSQK